MLPHILNDVVMYDVPRRLPPANGQSHLGRAYVRPHVGYARQNVLPVPVQQVRLVHQLLRFAAAGEHHEAVVPDNLLNVGRLPEAGGVEGLEEVVAAEEVESGLRQVSQGGVGRYPLGPRDESAGVVPHLRCIRVQRLSEVTKSFYVSLHTVYGITAY